MSQDDIRLSSSVDCDHQLRSHHEQEDSGKKRTGVSPNRPPPVAKLSSAHVRMAAITALWLNIALNYLHCVFDLPAFCISFRSCPGSSIAPKGDVRPPGGLSGVGGGSLNAIYSRRYQR